MNHLVTIAVALLLLVPARAATAQTFATDATLVEPGRVTIGLLEPARVGLASGVELYVSPWVMPVSPNAGLRVSRPIGTHLAVGLDAGAHSPSFALTLAQREGIGGFIPAGARVPLLLATDLSATGAVRLSSWLTLSAAAGGRFALGADERLGIIELPFVLPRTAPYASGWGGRARVSAEGELPWALSWEAGVEAFVSPIERASWALEPSAQLAWTPLSWLRLTGGARMFVGEMPTGVYVSTLWPFVDASVGFDVPGARR